MLYKYLFILHGAINLFWIIKLNHSLFWVVNLDPKRDWPGLNKKQEKVTETESRFHYPWLLSPTPYVLVPQKTTLQHNVIPRAVTENLAAVGHENGTVEGHRKALRIAYFVLIHLDR